MKKILKILILIFFIFLALTSSVYAQYFVNNNDEIVSSVIIREIENPYLNKIYIGFDIGYFMPAISLSARINFRVEKWFGWGAAINFFYVGGLSINAEVFAKFSIVNTDIYELSISVGFLIGYGEEFSFGGIPKKGFCLGPHLVIEPAIFKLGPISISFIIFGAEFAPLVDGGFSYSVYIGSGIRYYF
jgi:hypothetical protein